MSYTLYGSQTSLFVRRLRILLSDIPYTFKEINIFEADGATELNRINPVNQIPVLTDGDLTIWDSRQIFNYLNSLHRFQNMDWHDENTLTAVDGMMNAGVNLFMLKRSGVDIDEKIMFINRQRERIESVLDYLKSYISNDGLKEWNFHTISIYCFLDWALFRNVISIGNRPECKKFMDTHKNRDAVITTQIPRV